MDAPSSRAKSYTKLGLIVAALTCLFVAAGVWDLFRGLHPLAALVAAVFVAIGIFNSWAAWRATRPGPGRTSKTSN